MDTDDEIELLKEPHSKESDTVLQSKNQNQASVNPGFVFHSNSSLKGSQTSLDESSAIDPGSVHALQTAFSSLQKKHNEQAKKYKDLMQRHRLVQKKVGISEESIMDPILANNAAGASEEDNTTTAEIRAKQGYIQHLERELLRCNNSLTKGNEEIERLKKQVIELDRSNQDLQYKHSRLETELRELPSKLLTAKTESVEKDNKIQQLEEALHTTSIRNDALQDEINDLKGLLDNVRVTADDLQHKENEIHELSMKLRSSESDRQSLSIRIRDLERQLSEKGREISALEAKHKQYVIENEINRAQVQRSTDGLDEVDGENELIEKAYNMIKEQIITVQELRNKTDQQRNLITELYKSKDSKAAINNSVSIKLDIEKIEDREAAQGASFHPQMEEKPRSPVYMNVGQRSDLQDQILPNLHTKGQLSSPNSAVFRQPNDRQDFRPLDGFPNQLSPRINDVLMPTGNENVPRMIASEQSPPLVMIGGNNVSDAKRGNVSHRGLTVSHSNVLNPTGVASLYNSPTNIRNSSPDNDQTGIMEVNNFGTRNFGTRPRTQINNVSHPNLVQNNFQSSSRLPDRMTQSEIILRGSSPSNQSNTPYQPVPQLDLSPLATRSYENVYAQGQIKENYENMPARYANQANYENVFQTKRPTGSPNNDYDHSIYVNDPVLTMGSRTAVEHQSPSQPLDESNDSVSALKICPACNEEFSRLTMEQFQRHVFECFDSGEETHATLQPQVNSQSEEDRACPMCGDVFPLTIPQETYEQHVLAHFGEEPVMDRFEIIN